MIWGGDESIRTIRQLIRKGLRGIDRVVAPGHATDFDVVWDGHDLIEAFTKTVSCGRY